ncbi:MAG: hypothetical protein LBD96_02605 [Treponema sp.]|jgi:hypothetical protein|nr:hypothetical protein [Treponema sp.]
MDSIKSMVNGIWGRSRGIYKPLYAFPMRGQGSAGEDAEHIPTGPIL